MSECVITGMGVISTAGFNLSEFWDNLEAGHVTYHKIPQFQNDPNYRITVGAQINDSSWNDLIPELKSKYGLASQYAIKASLAALDDAGLATADLPKERVAISLGTTMGEIQVEECMAEMVHESGKESLPNSLLEQYRTDRIGSAVKETIQSTGPVYNVPTACSAGNYAIALGKQLIELGHVDIAIVGGVDVFSRVAFTGFQRLLSLTPDLCRPFDRNRKGLVVGEGCGVVILERKDFAKARGARIRGEILGIGLTSDRYHMTAPHPDGEGAIRAMGLALAEAGLEPGDIDYISAHGTGTPTNDRVEAKALSKVFGVDKIPPTSSIKSMLGHAMGAASALELIASLQMMEYQQILPTVNFLEADPECPIDCVPNQARQSKIRYVLSNSFAFGGQIGSLIVKGA